MERFYLASNPLKPGIEYIVEPHTNSWWEMMVPDLVYEKKDTAIAGLRVAKGDPTDASSKRARHWMIEILQHRIDRADF